MAGPMGGLPVTVSFAGVQVGAGITAASALHTVPMQVQLPTVGTVYVGGESADALPDGGQVDCAPSTGELIS